MASPARKLNHISNVYPLVSEPEDCVKEQNNSVEWIIANTINETAQGDPDALAARIVAALERAGYSIAPDELGSQPFEELKSEMRPQDPSGDGRDWTFTTCEHGGDEPDTMPQAIEATDAKGRWAIYVPLTRRIELAEATPTAMIAPISDGTLKVVSVM
jgi:hypothetical protein